VSELILPKCGAGSKRMEDLFEGVRVVGDGPHAEGDELEAVAHAQPFLMKPRQSFELERRV
jgi:hypothetical protein